MKNKIKRYIYSFTAVVMVIVFSIPQVIYASDKGFKFTTYECVEGMYAENSWQDLSLKRAYGCPNALYNKYSVGLDCISFDTSIYDYYCIYVDGGYICFIGISMANHCSFLVNINRTTRCVDSIKNNEYLTEDIETVETNVVKGRLGGKGTLLYCDGYYDLFKYNTSASEPTWTQTSNQVWLNQNTDVGTDKLSIPNIIDTNIMMYSSYEYDMYNFDSYREGMQDHTIGGLGFEDYEVEVKTLTPLNINMKYFNGEEIVGGAPNYNMNLTFDLFTVEKINHPQLRGEVGAYIVYSMGSDLYNEVRTNPQWKLSLDFVITYSVTEYDNGFFSGGGTFVQDEVIYDNVLLELDSYITQDGKYMYDLNNIVGEGNLLTYLLLTENVNSGNSILEGKLGQSVLGAIDENFYGASSIGLAGDKYYKVNYLDIACTGHMYNEDLNLYSNSGWGHCNVISGQNSSYCNSYDSESGQNVPNQDSVVSGNNYFNVTTETDSNGNTYYNYYYYDTTNNTVTPSVGTTSSTLTLFFGNPLTLNGVSSGGGSSSSSSSGGNGDDVEVVIEDDDYTDLALRQDLIDGFGLLDNNDTEELDDGFLSVASAFFESIDPDASQILMFGLSSVVAVNILRAIFRR